MEDDQGMVIDLVQLFLLKGWDLKKLEELLKDISTHSQQENE
jgi:hypothetical protein